MGQRRASRAFPWAVPVKAAVTGTVLAIVLTRVDADRFRDLVPQAVGWPLAAAFAVSVLMLVTSTLRWEGLMRALGVGLSRTRLLALYTIGFFVSAFLPGVVAGDVVRCHLAGRSPRQRLEVAATILAERFTGIATLVLLSGAALLGPGRVLATPPVVALVTVMACATLAGLAIARHRRLASLVTYRTRRSRLRPIAGLLYRLHRVLRTFPRAALLVAGAWSVMFYLVGGLALFLICRAFGITLGYAEAASVQVLVCLLTAIPISIGGLGIAQAGDVYLLGMLGVEPTRALGISLMRQLVSYGYALVGGAVFVAWRPARSASRAPDEELTGKGGNR